MFQANIWPGQYYNTFAQIATHAPTFLNSVDATGKVAGVRFYVERISTRTTTAPSSGSTGQQQQRARVNLDYDVRSNMLVSISTLYDKSVHGHARRGIFGTAAPRRAGRAPNYARASTRWAVSSSSGGGAGLRGTGNGAAGFLYPSENVDLRTARRTRFTAASTPATSRRTGSRSTARSATTRGASLSNFAEIKGYPHHHGVSRPTNNGQQSLTNAQSRDVQQRGQRDASASRSRPT